MLFRSLLQSVHLHTSSCREWKSSDHADTIIMTTRQLQQATHVTYVIL